MLTTVTKKRMPYSKKRRSRAPIRPASMFNRISRLNIDDNNLAFFGVWLNTAAHPASIPLITLQPYYKSPIAGVDKYQTYKVGNIWGLAPGLSGPFREARKALIEKSYFKACSNYWCVKRCIVRWKRRHMKERSSLEIFASGESLNTVPKSMWISIIQDNEKYTFYIRDLIRLFHQRLTQSDYFIPEPLCPTNPLTGKDLSHNCITTVIMQCIFRGIPLPWSMLSYWKFKYNLRVFLANNYVALHENAIKNEAYSMDESLVEDIQNLYESLNLEEIQPSIDDAERLSLIPILIKCHQEALHSFFIIERSLCSYTKQLARQNILAQCTQASELYHKKTQFILINDCLSHNDRQYERATPSADNINIHIDFGLLTNSIHSQSLSLEAYDTEEAIDSP